MQFAKGKPAAGAFFDTDFASIESVLAVALLFGLQGKNDCRVAIITMSRPNLAVAGFADAVERFYKGPAGNFSQVPPIGMRTEGPAGETSPAFTKPFEKKNTEGKPVYTNQVKSVIETGDPATLIRNYLQAQYDANSFFVLAGPATNLAAALEFSGIPELLAAKLKYLVISDAANGRIKADIPAAKKVFAEWPTPIVLCGPEIARTCRFQARASIKNSQKPYMIIRLPMLIAPIRPCPTMRLSGDLAAALYAGRPQEGYFKLSGNGTISVDDQGRASLRAIRHG